MNNADEIVRGMRGYAVRAQKNNEFNTMQDFDAAADLIESLQADLARVTAERDAAVADMYLACKTSPCNNGICVKRNCAGNTIPCEFEWRGVKGEQE